MLPIFLMVLTLPQQLLSQLFVKMSELGSIWIKYPNFLPKSKTTFQRLEMIYKPLVLSMYLFKIYTKFCSKNKCYVRFRAAKVISELNLKKSEIWKDILKSLETQFGANWDTKRFAIRSSAIGEDSEELSAAGQNDTFLGCQGQDNIAEAILKCWASLFSYNSVEYRRCFKYIL